MKCEKAQQNIVLVTYGELPDEQMASLEQHLAECEACNRELKALLAMHEALAYRPVMEPSPNLLAQSRMRLDEGHQRDHAAINERRQEADDHKKPDEGWHVILQ